MKKKDEYGIYTITLDESQKTFNDIDLLREYLSERYQFSDEEIEIIFSCSLDKLDKSVLIDMVYEGYCKLGCTEDRDELENNLYNKVLKILNYHIAHNNFSDKSSLFMKEFEYGLQHYDEPDLGLESDGRTPKKR